MYLICKYWKNNTNSWSIVNVSPTSIVAHSKEINKEQPFFLVKTSKQLYFYALPYSLDWPNIKNPLSKADYMFGNATCKSTLQWLLQ